MQSNVRTTIVLPEDLLQEAKIRAVREKKPLSGLIREALEQKLSARKKKKVQRDPMRILGKYSWGTTSTFRREDIYAEHLKHKVPR